MRRGEEIKMTRYIIHGNEWYIVINLHLLEVVVVAAAVVAAAAVVVVVGAVAVAEKLLGASSGTAPLQSGVVE